MEQTTGVISPSADSNAAEHRIGPRPGSDRRTILLLGAALVVLLIVAMVTVLVVVLAFWRSSEPMAAEPAAKSYSGRLASPLRIAPVTAVSDTGCSGTGTPGRFADGGCFTLGDGGMAVIEVERVNTALQDGQWLVVLRFSSADTVALRALTTQNVGKRVALVLDGAVLSAPTIATPITGGEVRISGNFTKKDVDRIFGELSGA